MPRRKRGRPLDPKVHPTTPERIVAWHDLMIGRLQARKSWPLLSSHMLYELRACPTCGRPVMRWRRLDEIKFRVMVMALRVAGDDVTLAARRLRISRRTIHYHLPATTRDRLAL